MADIDERVVAMSFENAKFEAGVAQTMATLTKLDVTLTNIGKTSGLSNIEADASKVTLTAPMTALDKLKQKLGLTNAGTTFTDMEAASDKVALTEPMTALDKLKQKLGLVTAGTTFSDMEKAADQVSFSGLIKGLDNLGNKFSVLQGAASVALGGIITKAATAGASVAKSLSLDPILAGFHNYETQINAVQTILANTGLSGAKGLATVTDTLKQLNTYANKTVYNFSEMTSNIGTFTAAGVDLKTSVDAIKGIANLAALSGSNSQQASTAMYQLSQAIAAGKVGLQDWNSVVNAGMGGAVFQRALATTAEKMGTLKKGSVDLIGPMKKVSINGQSFREAITAKPGEKSWLTSDVLTNTLKQFTGDLSDAQLKAQGFNDAEIAAIQKQAKVAVGAATNIKTFSQLMDALKEEVATSWGAIFKTLFGDINGATSLFSGMHTVLENMLTGPVNNFNKVLEEWAKLGGRNDFIEGLKAGFEALGTVIKPLKDAFQEIFPPATGKSLTELSEKFKDFMESLKLGPEAASNLKDTFAGLFSLLHIGVTVVEDIFKAIGHLLGATAGGSGGFLAFTASIGRFITAADQALTKGGLLGTLFDGLVGILKVPLKILKELAGLIYGLFNGLGPDDGKKLADAAGSVGDALSPLAPIVTAVGNAFDFLIKVFDKVKDFVTPILGEFADLADQVLTKLVDSFEHMNLSVLTSVIQTTLIGGIFLAVKKAIEGGGKGLSVDFGGGVLKNLSETFEALTGNLQAMQKNIQAGTLLKIAAAIGVLALGIGLLAAIDPKALTRAMTAVAVGMGELVGAMALLNKAAGGTAFIRMPFIAASLIGLAVAVTILAAAMKIFATMSWEDLAKGLVGVAGALVAVGTATRLIGPQTLIAAAALIPLALGIRILAGAVTEFSKLSWENMAKGLLGVAGALVAVGAGVEAIGPSVLLVGPGLIALAIGLNLLAGAVSVFGRMDLGTLAKGIGGIAGALIAIGLAIEAVPPTIALQAAGLVILAAALAGISASIGILGSMSIGKLVKGIVAMGGALVVLGLGLDAMSGSLPGTVALLGAAAAFAILGPTLAFLGTLKWDTIFKGLAAIALTLGTLAVVGALAAVPLLALGVGLTALGLGMAAIAGSVYLLAKGLTLLGSEGTKGVAVLIASFTAFVAILPKIIIDFLSGLVEIIAQVAKIAPQVLLAVGTMLDSIIAFVIEAAPKLAVAVDALLAAFFKVVNDNIPNFANTGLLIVTTLLGGLAANIDKVAESVAAIIAGLLNGLAKQAPALAGAGLTLLTAFLSGIADHFINLVNTVITMVAKFVNAVASQIDKIVAAGANLMVKFIAAIASYEKTLVLGGANVILSFLDGIAKAAPGLISKGLDIAEKFLLGISHGLVGLAKTGADAVIDFMNGIADAIRTKGPELRAAGYNVAGALLDGMTQGIAELGQKIVDKLGDLVRLLPKKVKDILGIKSPSTVFAEIGGHIMDGLSQGISDGADGVSSTMSSAAQDIVDKAKDGLGSLPGLLDGIIDTEPVITPVLDLSSVQKDAKTLGDLTNVIPISAAASFGQAAAISAEKDASDTVAAEQAATSNTFSFVQNNTSPEALSDVEIYRQTNNQLAKVKSLVGLPA